MKETPIQRSILDNLSWRGVLCWRNQQIPVPIRRGKAIVGLRRADPHTVGMPDICALINGLFVGVEVKSEKGRQSPGQKRWQELIEKNGGIYVLAHSWEEFCGKLNEAGCSLS